MKNQLKYAHGKWTFNLITTVSYPLLLIKIWQVFCTILMSFFNGRVTWTLTRLLKTILFLLNKLTLLSRMLMCWMVAMARLKQGESRADTHSAQQAPDHNVHNQSSSSELDDRLCVLPVQFKVLMYSIYAATSVSSLLHLSNCSAAGRLSGMGLSSTWNRWDTLSEYWEEVGLHVFMQ